MSENIEQNAPDYDRFIDEEELKHEALITSTTWILIPIPDNKASRWQGQDIRLAPAIGSRQRIHLIEDQVYLS